MADKEELLAAIAAAGTQGKVDYEAAQARNAQLQQQAIQAALAGAAWAPQGMQNQISQTIALPYDQTNAHIAANDAAQETYMHQAQWNTGVFQGNLDKLRDALTAQAYAEASARASSGGSGGGGGGSGDEPKDWYDNLKDAFGTAAIGKSAINAEAQSLLGSYKDTGLAPYEQVQKYAVEKYGVPEGVAAAWYTQPKDDAEYQGFAKEALGKAKTVKSLKKFVKTARATGKKMPGNQKYINAPLKAQAKDRIQTKKQRRRQRRGR